MSISMIGLDTAKLVFQLHGIDDGRRVQLVRKLRRSELIPFFERQPRCSGAMEACGAAHHSARVLSGLDHEVKLIKAREEERRSGPGRDPRRRMPPGGEVCRGE